MTSGYSGIRFYRYSPNPNRADFLRRSVQGVRVLEIQTAPTTCIVAGDFKYSDPLNYGFVFSRLEPYENWEQLYTEGMRLWAVYVELARPVEVHRIGLRYVNRIQLPPGDSHFEDYLAPAPAPPPGLEVPFYGFLHQDMLAVPGHPYAINVIRTIQPPGTPGVQGFGLILDIDAFTTQGFELDGAVLEERLLEMRWLKNKLFFGSVTSTAMKLFSRFWRCRK